MSIDVSGLAAEISQSLEDYSDEVAEKIKVAARACAEQCKKDVKEFSPKATGDYKKGWRVKVAYESRENIRLVVYNKTNYQLAHLLEHGHAKRTGGRVEGKPHISTAEKRAVEEFEKRVKEAIE